MSAEAAQNGVRLNMRRDGALTVAPETIILERSEEREKQTLEAVATALMQFTPEITFQENFSVLLDVSASLTLFKGPHALCTRINNTLGALGVTSQIGIAPTAKGAWLLARSKRQAGLTFRRRTLSMRILRHRLSLLPCDLLPQALPYRHWIDDIGARHIGDLRKLPRAGLLRRTSKELICELDCAYGEETEMFEWIKPPLQFSARVELYDRVEHTGALLQSGTSLITQLIGWLRSFQRAVRGYTFFLEHERGRAAIAPTEIDIVLAEPAWESSHLIRLLKERLPRIQLTAPVIALRLEVAVTEAACPINDSLFPEPGGSLEDYHRLLELLTTRLGSENVLTPSNVEDYRPEVYNAWVSATTKSSKACIKQVISSRPFFLLPKPIALLMRDERPFYGSPLKIIRGPERIEGGWWDAQSAARDYFIAQGNDGSCYWIYLERSNDARWFLHGLYA